MISIAAEMERIPEPFQFLNWNDEWLDSAFRACMREAVPKMKVYYQRGYLIQSFTVDEEKLRKELEKRDINENTAVMIAMDALKRFGSIRIAH